MEPETSNETMSVPETTSAPQPAAPVAQRANPFIIPASILIGFAMIAAAIYFSGGINGKAPATGTDQQPEATTNEPIKPVSDKDHIQGNPNAPIVFVEYSDFDCPFCKKFHEETMTKIMNEFGPTGKVALVYRHFPLEQLHPNAPKLALASECIAEQGGNDAFWKFADLVFGERAVNEQTNIAKLPDYAKQSGVDVTKFNTCMTEDRYSSVVQADFTDGVNAGVQGTPHTFVLVGGQQAVISGAQSYATVKQLTENLIKQLEGGTPQ